MASGRSMQLTKQVGEYLVASELARRGMLVATFSGNVPDFDLVATNPSGASCPIQVKTINGGGWQFSIDRFVEVHFKGNKQIIGRKKKLPIPELICVFVLTDETYGKDQFFVLEWAHVQKMLIRKHKRYLASHGGRRPKNPRSLHCAIRPSDLGKYRDNWDLVQNEL